MVQTYSAILAFFRRSAYCIVALEEDLRFIDIILVRKHGFAKQHTCGRVCLDPCVLAQIQEESAATEQARQHWLPLNLHGDAEQIRMPGN